MKQIINRVENYELRDMSDESVACNNILARMNNFSLKTTRTKWIELLRSYSTFSNPNFVHPFFGKMTKEQIGKYVYKHTDHYLRQFGN